MEKTGVISMSYRSTFRGIVAAAALIFPAAMSAQSNMEQQCRNEFSQSQAANSCSITYFIGASKPGQYWQCRMQIECSGSNGASLTTSSSWQLNLLDTLHYCQDTNKTKYGSC